MRIKILVIILLLLASYANAKQVTQEKAQQIAQAFLLKEQATPPQVATKTKGEFVVRNQAAGLTLGKIQPITDENGETLAYVQELESKGFIITSADDAIRPVLGFSFEGKFPFTPVRGNPLLNLIKVDVSARQKAVLSGEMDENEFQELFGFPTQWGPYIQTTWSQGGTYRSKCPYKDPNNPGVRRPTGCTAIAMAQIMYMHEYPKTLTFSDSNDHYISRSAVRDAQDQIIGYDVIDIDGSSSSYGFPTFNQLNSSLNPIMYDHTDEEIGNFCFGTGIKLRMNYGLSGSGAWRPEAYLNEFDYGSATYSTDWDVVKNDVIQNMKDALPAQIAIYNSNPAIRTGHSVIVDGYRDDGFFHLNYGWGPYSPDSISKAWYNIPAMPRYDVVSMVIYDISIYQGWNQYGANAQNTFGTIYAAPRADTVLLKWRATCPSEFFFSDILIGTSDYVYAAASTDGSSGHPFVYIIDQFGTTLRQIELNRDGNIECMCQSKDGDIFASMEGGYIYRIDPKQGSATQIFTESNGDDIYALKIDEDGWLFAVTFYRVYALTETGTLHWSVPFEVPSDAMILGSGYFTPIDLSRQRVYVLYRNTTTKYNYLAALNRLNGQVVQTRDFGAITLPSFRSISLGDDGTLYVRMPGILYALDPDNLLGTPLWTKSLLITQTPAVGRNGTLYFPYWEQISGTWYNKLGAFDPSNGATRWTITFQLDPNEEDIFQPYIAGNGIVLFTIEHNGTPKTYTLHAYKDNGSSAEELWNYNVGTSGGDYAFGPRRTAYAWGKTGLAQTIYALSDGEIGDPYGAGKGFENNNAPISVSNPGPADETKGQDTASVQLSWNSSDPDGHSLKYDIYACAVVDSEEVVFVPVATQVIGETYTLEHLQKGTQYLWYVVATDGQTITEGPVWTFSTSGPTDVDDEGVTILPTEFALGQNYPNPFNPVCNIEYSLPRGSHVRLSIYNILGQKVRVLVDEYQRVGNKLVTWDGKDNFGKEVASGIYFYQLTTADYTSSKKMVLLK